MYACPLGRAGRLQPGDLLVGVNEILVDRYEHVPGGIFELDRAIIRIMVRTVTAVTLITAVYASPQAINDPVKHAAAYRLEPEEAAV